MNRTVTSPGIVASPPLQRTQFFIAYNSPGSTHTPLDRGGISDDLTGFFSTNRALRAVKGTQKGNASYVGLTWHCGKSLVTTSPVFRRVQLTWKHPRRKIEVVYQVIEPTFPP